MRRHPPLALLWACLGCGDDVASDGSSDTAETGAPEGGMEEGGADGGDPGPSGPGCNESWETWWDEEPDQPPARTTLAPPEARAQHGQRRHGAPIDAHPSAPTEPTEDEDEFRATLISEAAVLSTGRNLAVSWCLGNIQPNPLGPGGSIDEELDATNLERYELLRAELERATRIWERHSRLNFVHLAVLDDRRKPSGGTCDTRLEHVWFRAQTGGCNIKYKGITNAGGESEFDPDAGSPQNPDGYERLLCVAWQLLDSAKTQIPYYAGHESGHIVGLQHEHTRWDQGETPHPNCKETIPLSRSRRT